MFRSLLFLLLFAGSLFAADKKTDAEVIARLTEIPGKMPGNDLYNYVYVFKYRVISVISGNVQEKEILVGQYNPRIARDQIKDAMAKNVSGNVQAFHAGDVHRLKLVQPMTGVWEGAVEDEYFDDETPRWFAVKTDSEKK